VQGYPLKLDVLLSFADGSFVEIGGDWKEYQSLNL
jgi:hypothetical protein